MRNSSTPDRLAMPRRERRRRGAARAGLVVVGSALATLLAAHPAGATPATQIGHRTLAVAHHVRYRPVVAAPATRNGIIGFGSAAALPMPATGGPWVAMTSTASGQGAWLVNAAGVVVPLGDAVALAPTDEIAMKAPVVGLVAAPIGTGYWIVTADGAVFAFGAPTYHGSVPPLAAGERVVGMAPTPDDRGYWLATSSGQVIAYGDAPILGTAVGRTPSAPVVAITSTRTGRGYWVTQSDGHVFPFGDAANLGSPATLPQGDHVIGLAATSDDSGYWLATSGGAVIPFGRAAALGSLAGSLHTPVVGIAPQRSGTGYWLTTAAQASPAAPTAALPTQRPAAWAGRSAGAPGGIFSCIRQRESGGNYATNTGNGYYGAYQFSLATWHSVGGQGVPSQASPAEQDQRARMLQQRSGYGQWSTARSCGG